MSEVEWYVAHTRPRREKKLKEYCEKEGLSAILPCFRSVHKYRGKTVTFDKPLFPGYLFMHILSSQRTQVIQNEHVARILAVYDQVLFAAQLQDILTALETEFEIRLAPEIGPGRRVKIKSGPLRGMEAWVEDRQGMTTVLLRLDFIGQAAAVKVPADQLELI
jgi:transcriptional antiterminator RfaH